MIVSHVIGGLGNQMFQYAFGKSRALALGVELRLHVADFVEYSLHQGFELDRVFDSSFQIVSDDEFRSFLGWRSNRYCRKALRHHYLSALRGAQFVVEPNFQFWPDVLNVRDDSYLVGYWQSEKYFSGIQEAIRSDFVFKQNFTAQNAEIAAKINQCNAVSIHVRRGDYAKNAKTSATHGLCSLDYYKAAVHYISARVKQPVFFIFSDDIAWVKDNLKMDFPCHYVDHNVGAESYNDMRLMSMYSQHIIANSSFSWWAAWLNPNPEKIVIAPRKWFANGNKAEDLFPRGWVTL